MRTSSVLFAGLLAFLIVPCAHARVQDATNSDETSRGQETHCIQDDLKADEVSAQREPKVAAVNGCTLTILADGHPLATFTNTTDIQWHFKYSFELTEQDGTQRRAYVVDFDEAESDSDILLDPDGRLHNMGWAMTVLPGGRLMATGNLSDTIDGWYFGVVDWPRRKAYQSDTACSIEKVKSESHLSLICSKDYDSRHGYFSEADQLSDGRWRITPTEGFDFVQDDELYDRNGDPEVKRTPLQPEEATPVTINATAIADDTDFFTQYHGFRWLGR